MKFSTLWISILVLLSTQVAYAQPSSPDKKVFITNEATINSDHLEYSPAFLEDGIVFISSRPAGRRYKVKDKRINVNIMSIFQAQREENGLLRKPKPFANELLSTVHEGPLTFDRTADNIYFTRNNRKNGKSRKAKDGKLKLRIYSAERVDSTWKNVTDLPINLDDSNTCHPSISVEGDALYFASDREGGQGGMDIWVAYQKGGLWSEPENLGPTINTDGNEVFPFIHADGTLYFASSGHAGYGELDVFASQNAYGTWGAPSNLGTPFNSEKDDFGFIIDRDKKNGYFSSSRAGGLGGDDIYSYYVYDGLDRLLGKEAPEAASKLLTFLVSDLSTGSMLDSARVTYANINNLALSNAINAITESNNSNGEVLLRLPLEGNSKVGLTDRSGKLPATLTPGSYVFLIEKAGFEPQQIIINTESEEGEIFVSLADAMQSSLAGGDPTTTPSGMDNSDGSGDNEDFGSPLNNLDGENNESFPSTIKEGTVFQLPNIYYNFNDATIRPDARIDLDALAAFLNKYPDIEIELASHTDSRGGTRYNRRLSQQRAERAVDYLTTRGIDPSRMIPVGFGEGQLRNQCTDGADCSEVQHQYNRRTEVKITKMSQEINIKFVRDDSMPIAVDDAPVTTPSYTTSTESSEFKVVAGVFRSYDNAQSRLSKLIALGYSAEISSVGDTETYSVIVGRYYDFEEARSAVQSLRSDHMIRSFIKR